MAELWWLVSKSLLLAGKEEININRKQGPSEKKNDDKVQAARTRLICTESQRLQAPFTENPHHEVPHFRAAQMLFITILPPKYAS